MQCRFKKTRFANSGCALELLDDRITILSRQANATRVCVGINVKKHASENSGHNPGVGGFIDLNAFQNQ